MLAGPDVGDYIDDYYREATKLVGVIEEVAQHYRAGKLEAACGVAAISHTNLSRLISSRDMIVEKFAKQGVEPKFGETR